ncbi:hypothetical protein BST61_g1565 [Cercospora zeina]
MSSLTDPTQADLIKHFPPLLCTCRLVFHEARPYLHPRTYKFSRLSKLKRSIAEVNPQIDALIIQPPAFFDRAANRITNLFSSWRDFLFPGSTDLDEYSLDRALPSVRSVTVDIVQILRLLTAQFVEYGGIGRTRGFATYMANARQCRIDGVGP